MVEDISNYFFAKLARIIETLAYKKGYKVIFCSNENDDKKSKELINLFNVRQVDGFIVVPSPGIRNAIESLIKENIPVVLLDRYFPDLDTNYVIVDNKSATYDATTHLIKNNYKNIAFITTDTEQTQMIDRLEGYKKAILDNNLIPNILQIPFLEINNGQSLKYIKNFIEESVDLDSVFFATNYLTQSGLEVFNKYYPKLIGELGIVTFDDHDFFKIYHPPITAVSQPLKEIGDELMKLMLSLLKKKDVSDSPKHIVLNAHLEVRTSSENKK